jgi:ubiquitin C-terminal hydrolase
MKKLLILWGTLLISSSLIASKPIGLKNVGNSCFINAALQCLLAIDELTATVLEKSKSYYTAESVSALYKDLLEELSKTEKATYDPSLFAQKGWQILCTQRGTQQDAAEFIDCLFKHLSDQDIDPSIRTKLPVYLETKQPKTDLSELFMALESSTIIPARLACRPQKKIEQCSMLHLSLDLSSKDLSQCLTSYFVPDFLQGKNQYKLGPGLFVDAIKFLTLTHTPLYLALDLKRVSNVLTPLKTFYYAKLSSALSFPLENLALTPYIDNSLSTGHEHYSLASFIVHSGSAFAGHYTAYVKKNNQWYYCNDETITPISDEQMQAIAQRGFCLDPAYVEGRNAQESHLVRIEQTPILFFYRKHEFSNTVQQVTPTHAIRADT